jgi:predicted nucleic acid-binding protein
MSLVFIDTNVLIYSISNDTRETHKRERARELLDRDNCALSVQVLQEFYVQATRPTRANSISHDLAQGFIRTWLRFTVQDVTVNLMHAALAIRARHGFSYWDSCIVAAAQSLSCAELMSEDMADGMQIAGVRIVNPFK